MLQASIVSWTAQQPQGGREEVEGGQGQGNFSQNYSYGLVSFAVKLQPVQE